jgi:hypothetical protein
MVDGIFTGKPNDFETRSAFPPIPIGLEPKKPDWLQDRIHKVRFDSEWKGVDNLLLEVDALLETGRRAREMEEHVRDQAEAYLQSFLALTHLTPEEFNERFVVIQTPGEIISMEDVNDNVFRYQLTLKIEPRKDFKDDE